MKLRDLVSVVKNKTNKQINLNLRKRELKQRGISEEDFLNMDLLSGKVNIKKMLSK